MRTPDPRPRKARRSKRPSRIAVPELKVEKAADGLAAKILRDAGTPLRRIKLANGRELRIGGLTIPQMLELAPEISWLLGVPGPSAKSADSSFILIRAILREHHPEITIADLESLLTFAEVTRLASEAIRQIVTAIFFELVAAEGAA